MGLLQEGVITSEELYGAPSNHGTATRQSGLFGTGGLSHVVIDEEIDQMLIQGILNKDGETLSNLPIERLNLGTSEIRNWVVAAGALEHLDMKLINYVPCYRSEAGTGCAMAFAIWR